ncbi:tripartite tricarboxylate transporter TctB family protein [Bacillus sp. FJAT-45350]|uniref:tripartite tricarboxylate transporter TctB family protein n=1 Tax=Bacillus sp. FJAT-45350 TaxID=2011014 RepID=UPI000BB78D75|nr:tripartite tricarboxylate transporter TctB family protein [Bacillus sp. FJAT-45350]
MLIRYLHRYGEIIVIACIFLVGLSLLIATDDIIKISAERAAGEPAGPKFWPLLVLTGLVLLSAFVLVKTIFVKRREKVNKQAEDEYLQDFSTTRLISLIVGMFIYLYLMQFLGFILSSLLFIYFVCTLIKIPLIKKLIFTFVSLGVFIFLFGKILYVPLPRGIGILRELSFFFY